MADKKISEMTAASAYTGTNEFYELVQGGNTRQGSHALLKDYFDTLYAPIIATASYYANTAAGFGATGTKIMYYTNEPTDSPNGNFTVSNDATNGLSITINAAGVYSFAVSYDTGAGYAGLSLNGSATTNISALSAGSILGIAYVGGTGSSVQVSVTRRFAVNDVIRPHTDGIGVSTAARNSFICEKIG